MKNTIIDVSGIEKEYDTPTGIFDDFSKIAEDGETDARLDTAIDCFKELIDLTRQGLDKQDMSLDKQDQMLAKQDQMIGKQDELILKQDETKDEIVGEVQSASFRLENQPG